jgi:hypothetical protein
LGMDESVTKTLKTWKCMPAVVKGKAVPTLVTVELNFHLK